MENPPQQETQTDLPQINQSTDIPDMQIDSQVPEHQDNSTEQMGSNIGIPVLRNNTQELQDTVGLQLLEIIAQSALEL